jgi:hypothetical protein
MSIETQNYLVIPVTNAAPSYKIKVNLSGVLYTLQFHFTDRMGVWMMDILDSSGNPIVLSIVLTTGYPIGYRYAERIPNFPDGVFYVVDETGQDQMPNLENFGNGVNLYFLSAQ